MGVRMLLPGFVFLMIFDGMLVVGFAYLGDV